MEKNLEDGTAKANDADVERLLAEHESRRAAGEAQVGAAVALAGGTLHPEGAGMGGVGGSRPTASFPTDATFDLSGLDLYQVNQSQSNVDEEVEEDV